MNIIVTSFVNPFSFFCKIEDQLNETDILAVDPGDDHSNNLVHKKSDISDVNHGQYVAVWWKGKWVRGIIFMESQFLIWLIDYGMHIRPYEKTVYVDLPSQYKKDPSKVFEASIHGVSPIDKVLTDDCQIKNKCSSQWIKGAIERAQSLITNATKRIFVPVAILSTKVNDVVLGDLYLQLPNGKTVNIIDELELWPVFLERNKELYINNMASYYVSRRKHRACLLKQTFENYDVPSISLNTTFGDYVTICTNAARYTIDAEYGSDSEDGATVIEQRLDKSSLRLTPSQIEEYADMYVTVHGREYNVLNVLLNKIRDLNMCDRYRDHDLKSIGRATSRRSFQ